MYNTNTVTLQIPTKRQKRIASSQHIKVNITSRKCFTTMPKTNNIIQKSILQNNSEKNKTKHNWYLIFNNLAYLALHILTLSTGRGNSIPLPLLRWCAELRFENGRGGRRQRNIRIIGDDGQRRRRHRRHVRDRRLAFDAFRGRALGVGVRGLYADHQRLGPQLDALIILRFVGSGWLHGVRAHRSAEY